MSPLRRATARSGTGSTSRVETVRLTHDSVAAHPLRSILAVLGIVIGIVTVVLVASVLANVRNSVALLFRELGTENVFAFHRSGDPYSPPSEKEARRLPLKPDFAEVIAREGRHVRDVGVQVIVPPDGERPRRWWPARARTSRTACSSEGVSPTTSTSSAPSSRRDDRSRSSRTGRGAGGRRRGERGPGAVRGDARHSAAR